MWGRKRSQSATGERRWGTWDPSPYGFRVSDYFVNVWHDILVSLRPFLYTSFMVIIHGDLYNEVIGGND